MGRKFVGPSILWAVLAQAAISQNEPFHQTLPRGFESTDGNGFTSNPFTSNTAVSQRWQWVYDSAEFEHQDRIEITEISVRFATPSASAAGGSFPDVTVRLASSPNDYRATGTPPAAQSATFEANLGPDVTVVRSGPWVTGAIPAAPPGSTTGTWIPLGLTAPFVYDPALGLDLILDLAKCGNGTQWATASLDTRSGPGTTVGGNRYGNISSCAAPGRSSSGFVAGDFVPIIRIAWQPVLRLTLAETPGGASLFIDSTGGTPGHRFLNAMTQVRGAYPFGWFHGIDIPLAALLAEIDFGAWFHGPFDGTGNAHFEVAGPLPGGITAYCVVVEVSPEGFVTRAGRAFAYTTVGF